MSTLSTLFAVLMVGHSLFGKTGPTMLERALQAGGRVGTVQAQIINGAPLRYNWDQSASAEGVDARAELPKGGTTHLILTEAIPLDNHIKWSETGVYAQAFGSLAMAANPDVQIYVQETWHSLKSGTGEAVEYDEKAGTPWRDRLDQDLPVWEKVVAEVAANMGSNGANVALIPAGQAMARLYDEIAAGKVPALPGISALFDDDIHLNHTGHYFVAMVQYAVLTGQQPLGLPVDFKDKYGVPFDLPSAELARTLQQIAWDAVVAYGGVSAMAAPPSPAIHTNITQAVETPEPTARGTNAVAIGLASVADWSTQVPFLDLMKSSRPFFGHRPGRWGGVDHAELRAEGILDGDGWPVKVPRSLGSIGTLILTDMPVEAVSLQGRYLLRYDGKGVIEVAGRAQNVRYGPGEISFDYSPGPGNVDIRVQRVNAADPLRNITIVQQVHRDAFDAGAIFNPIWLEHLAPFSALRFMDWMETNNSVVSGWDSRPQVSDVSYVEGTPLEVMIALANRLEADPWFNLPHLADDTHVRRFAQMVRNDLDPGLTAYVEFSNEVWNWQFAQARWADDMARARWGENDKWMQYYGLRAAEVARIWSDVFGNSAKDRLVNVISTQTGWLGLESEVLQAPLAVAEGIAPPLGFFDAYAVSGYFGGILGLEDNGPMVMGWIAESEAKATDRAHRYDHAFLLAGRALMDGAVTGNPVDTVNDLIERVWPYHAQVARDAGLDLIMYEGGSHVVGIGAQVDNDALTAFMQHFNYSAEMGALYDRLLAGWQAVGGQLFNAYSDVYAPSKWGSWGGLRHLDDANPRWDALVAFQ